MFSGGNQHSDINSNAFLIDNSQCDLTVEGERPKSSAIKENFSNRKIRLYATRLCMVERDIDHRNPIFVHFNLSLNSVAKSIDSISSPLSVSSINSGCSNAIFILLRGFVLSFQSPVSFCLLFELSVRGTQAFLLELQS